MKELVWADIKSKTMNPDEYLELYKNNPLISTNFEYYHPKKDVLAEIKEILENNERINFFAIGADWCPDCRVQVPHLIKVIKTLDLSELNFSILYGVKVNPLRKKDELKWSRRGSPPEAMDPKFDLTAIPTIYIFNSSGHMIGKIVERPENTPTIEEEVLFHFKNGF